LCHGDTCELALSAALFAFGVNGVFKAGGVDVAIVVIEATIVSDFFVAKSTDGSCDATCAGAVGVGAWFVARAEFCAWF
jgi:hypothetical protein